MSAVAEKECAIPFCDAPDGEGFLPVCPNGHFMHDSCAADWMAKAPGGRPTCPACRNDCLDRFAQIAADVASRRAMEMIEERQRALRREEQRQEERLQRQREELENLQKQHKEEKRKMDEALSKLEEERAQPTNAELERLLLEREATVRRREQQVRKYIRPIGSMGGGDGFGCPLAQAFASPAELDDDDPLSDGMRAWERFRKRTTIPSAEKDSNK